MELIHQRDDTPTLYRDFLATSGEGLAAPRLPARPTTTGRSPPPSPAGWEVAHEGGGSGTRFVYLDGGGHPGSVTELVDLAPRTASFFDHMASEAATWDGSPDQAQMPPR